MRQLRKTGLEGEIPFDERTCMWNLLMPLPLVPLKLGILYFCLKDKLINYLSNCA